MGWWSGQISRLYTPNAFYYADKMHRFLADMRIIIGKDQNGHMHLYKLNF